MKKFIYAVIICLLMAPPVFSAPPVASAYWTVETGHTPQPYSIVRFYSAGHRQLMEKKISGKRLQICRWNVRRQLDRDLEKFLQQEQVQTALTLLYVY